MDINRLKAAYDLCSNNRAMTGECGCFYCQKTFDASEIVEWTDKGQTAHCPHCSIDSVIPAGEDRTTPEFLLAMFNHWFPESAALRARKPNQP